MGSLLFVVAEQMKPGAAAKPAAVNSSAANSSSAATAPTATKSGAVRVWRRRL